MVKIKIGFFALVGSLALLSGCDPAKYLIRGHVTAFIVNEDNGGRNELGIPTVEVELRCPHLLPKNKETKTDSNGRYLLEGIGIPDECILKFGGNIYGVRSQSIEDRYVVEQYPLFRAYEINVDLMETQ